MRVLKFGGSSVANAERIASIVSLLRDRYGEGERLAVVVSALGGATDALLEMSKCAAAGDDGYRTVLSEFGKRHRDTASELLNEARRERVLSELGSRLEDLSQILHSVFVLREVSLKAQDHILSFGERNSATLLAHTLMDAGVSADYLDARTLIQTDDRFGSARVQFDQTNASIRQYFQNRDGISVITGFIAANSDGRTTTLGRGGSDYTAAILGAALKAEAVEIWTDVTGVLTADPRKVPEAFTIKTLTYAEAMELSHFGAKVIYPPTIQPVLDAGIEVWIRNVFEPKDPGSRITHTADNDERPVRGISSLGEVAFLNLSGGGLVGVPGTAGRLFASLSDAKVNVILITQGSSEHSICFAIHPGDIPAARAAVAGAFELELERGTIQPLSADEDVAVVAVVGENMRRRPGISARVFEALGKNGVNVVAIAQGSSERNISIVVRRSDEAKALNALHDGLFLSDHRRLNVFMVGVGLIGKTLLAQMDTQHAALLKEDGLDLRVVGLANSRRMAFDANGISRTDFAAALEAGEAMDMAAFTTQMKAMNLPNAVFVDNTASADIAKSYESILLQNISISTPNKEATSGSYPMYKRLRRIADDRGADFLFETNVGAGLPVLSTLKDLLKSGDKIHKIEGVLSGSLSFIFNEFGADTSFSEIVTLAKTRGFTEPDPRVDLMGLDVCRKLVILARTAGWPLERDNIQVESILPDAVANAPSVEAFFSELQAADAGFSEQIKAAQARGERLRLIGEVTQSGGRIALQSVGPSHPFYGLSGSDNMVVFTSERYKERPLVVQGPGAGAEVTAAGVFAEILKIGNTRR